MKTDNFDDRYDYYFYGVNNICDIDDCFNNGLTIDNENCLEHSFNRPVFLNGLNESLSEYAVSYNYDMVFVVKIPSYYVGWIHRNEKLEPFVPFLISKKKNLPKKVIANLVYGVYDKNSGKYLSNCNYNPLYDPSGLHYANVQLNYMYRVRCFNLYQDSLRRNIFAYDELKMMDDEDHVWDSVIKHYNGNKMKKVLRKIFK